MLACQPSTLTQRSMHHQKSSSDSPFQANTATPRRRGASLASAEFSRALLLGQLRKATNRRCKGPCRDQTTAHNRIKPVYPFLKDIWSKPSLKPAVWEQGCRARRGWKGSESLASALLTSFCQGSCHFILGGIDVTGRPAALRSQCAQRLNQHLQDSGLSSRPGER